MRILKVKFKEGVLHIEYALPNQVETGDDEDKWDEYSCTFKKANPKPELPACLVRLRRSALELCEIGHFQDHQVTVTGVSFSYGGEKEVMGAVITFQVAIASANSPLCLNTPHKPSDSYNDDDPLPSQTLAYECIRILDELIVQARAFMMGERGQVELKLEDAEKKPVTKVELPDMTLELVK
jgi:hypothetical protein